MNGGEPGEEKVLAFRVLNFTNRAVNLVGAGSTCTCVATRDLPLQIPAGESRPVSVVVRFPQEPSSIDEVVSFISDLEGKPRLPTRIVTY
jgi:hypothetical protein